MTSSELEPIPVTPQKHDPAWKHCQMFKNGDRVLLKCIYCEKAFRGGGIHRIKEHLAGQKGNASTCLRVLPDVRLLMLDSLNGAIVNKKRKQKISEEITTVKHPDDDPPNDDTFTSNQDDMNIGLIEFSIPDDNVSPHSALLSNQENETIMKRFCGRKKRGRPRNIHSSSETFFIPGGGSSFSLGEKTANHQVHMAIGRFLYDVGLPPDAVNSPYFQPMLHMIASQGTDVIPPSCHDLRGWILKNTLDEVKNKKMQYMETWGKTGCSLLVDECSSENKGLTFMNISVNCPQGSMFLKSVDISETKNSPYALYELMKEAVEEVGMRNVVQVITRSSDERYVVAGNKLADTLHSLYWSPCASESIDSMLEDFGKLEWICSVMDRAKCVTRFIYDHSVVLNMMRRYSFGNELVDLGFTRFSTDFVTLKRMWDLKQSLQGMVTSQEWADCIYSKKPNGLFVSDVISNDSFWSSVQRIIQLTNPLLRVLRIIVAGERRPGIGYIYAGIYKAKDVIKKEIVKRNDYLVYWNIIDSRWEHHRGLALHAAGFYLNPRYFYGVGGDMHNDIVSGMLDCVERLVPDIIIQDKIMNEINSYKNTLGDFGRKMAIRARDTMLPAEWWLMYGGGCPNLMRLAVRILSQCCCCSLRGRLNVGISACEQMHGTRYWLEQQWVRDLVFVRQNLRLCLGNQGQGCVDPISVDSLEEWIVERNAWRQDEEDEECGCSVVDPPFFAPGQAANDDDLSELQGGFDDGEIFEGVKEVEEMARLVEDIGTTMESMVKGDPDAHHFNSVG